MNRLKPVDGLRACAVAGVIWAHLWLFFNNIGFTVMHIDINRILSFGGIGVDLFFVISGFCMFLMYQKKQQAFDINSYGNFIVKRWKRIAPAFYAVVLIECIIYASRQGVFPAENFLSHLFFVNTLDRNVVLSPSFWSLATEWHFYVILPFLFIGLRNNREIIYRVLILSAICIGFRIQLFSSNIFLQRITINSDMIWYRFIEFGFGILAAWHYSHSKPIPNWLKGNIGFLITVIIAIAGRALMTTEVLVHFGRVAFLGRAFAEPVLTFGFALMILNLVSSESIFSRILTMRFFTFIGRISYSMYLWHWIIAINLSAYVIDKFGITQVSFYLTFIGVNLLLIPIALLWYKILEEPYFKKSNATESISVVSQSQAVMNSHK